MTSKFIKHIILYSTFIILTQNGHALELKDLAGEIKDKISPKARTLPKDSQLLKESKHKRIPKYRWGYIDRKHEFKEDLSYIGMIYGLTWPIYFATQPDVVKDKGSFKNYKKNFGNLVFDKDEPLWNWFVHPISGSQLFLFYRANGYSRISALTMSIVSSTLFEFTVEIYTEPASVQDLYQTPILGAVFGVCLEQMSLYFLNTGNMAGRFLGHVLNPSTLFWFYEGKVRLLPQIDPKGNIGLNLNMDF